MHAARQHQLYTCSVKKETRLRARMMRNWTRYACLHSVRFGRHRTTAAAHRFWCLPGTKTDAVSAASMLRSSRIENTRCAKNTGRSAHISPVTALQRTRPDDGPPDTSTRSDACFFGQPKDVRRNPSICLIRYRPISSGGSASSRTVPPSRLRRCSAGRSSVIAFTGLPAAL